MSYIPPTGSALVFTWVGSAPYIPPVWDGSAFVFPQIAFVIEIATTVSVVAATGIDHGAALAGVANVSVTADMSADHIAVNIDATLSAAIEVVAGTDIAHGISGSGVASVPIAAGIAVAHGLSLVVITTVPIAADASLSVDRYELRGEVRMSGVLVNRRVRAYLRSSGELMGEVDTVAGRFALHAGFAPTECYITPIDLSAGATDWSPPTANRILSVLALDTA